MSKREKNKIIIRERLLKEAKKLFATQGFEKTTITEIVQACDIAKGTFYNYFSDAKALFDAVIHQLNTEIRLVVREARKDCFTLYDFLFHSFKSYFDYVSTDNMLEFHQKNQAFIRSTSYGSDSIKAIIADLQTDLINHRVIDNYKAAQQFQLLSFVLVGTAAELFLNIHATEVRISNEELAHFLANLFTKGAHQ